jgi:hypothetical protein
MFQLVCGDRFLFSLYFFLNFDMNLSITCDAFIVNNSTDVNFDMHRVPVEILDISVVIIPRQCAIDETKSGTS